MAAVDRVRTSEAMEDYAKAIYALAPRGDGMVTTTALAERASTWRPRRSSMCFPRTSKRAGQPPAHGLVEDDHPAVGERAECLPWSVPALAAQCLLTLAGIRQLLRAAVAAVHGNLLKLARAWAWAAFLALTYLAVTALAASSGTT